MILEVLKCIAFVKKRGSRIRCLLNLDRRRRKRDGRARMRIVFTCRLSMPRRKAAERTHLRPRVGRSRSHSAYADKTPREQVSPIYAKSASTVRSALRGERVKRTRRRTDPRHAFKFLGRRDNVRRFSHRCARPKPLFASVCRGNDEARSKYMKSRDAKKTL